MDEQLVEALGRMIASDPDMRQFVIESHALAWGSVWKALEPLHPELLARARRDGKSVAEIVREEVRRLVQNDLRRAEPSEPAVQTIPALDVIAKAACSASEAAMISICHDQRCDDPYTWCAHLCSWTGAITVSGERRGTIQLALGSLATALESRK